MKTITAILATIVAIAIYAAKKLFNGIPDMMETNDIWGEEEL
jgi:hypothetical protein